MAFNWRYNKCAYTGSVNGPTVVRMLTKDLHWPRFLRKMKQHREIPSAPPHRVRSYIWQTYRIKAIPETPAIGNVGKIPLQTRKSFALAEFRVHAWQHGPIPSAYFPMSLRKNSSQRLRNAANAAS